MRNISKAGKVISWSIIALVTLAFFSVIWATALDGAFWRLDPLVWSKNLDNMDPEEVVKWYLLHLANGEMIKSLDALTAEYREQREENVKRLEPKLNQYITGFRMVYYSSHARLGIDQNTVFVLSTSVDETKYLTTPGKAEWYMATTRAKVVRENGKWRIASLDKIDGHELTHEEYVYFVWGVGLWNLPWYENDQAGSDKKP